jgi:hypothetical protein
MTTATETVIGKAMFNLTRKEGHRKKLPAGCGGEKSNAQIRRERMAAFIAENPGVKGVELQAKFPDMNSFDITAMRRDKVIQCVRDRNFSRYYATGYVEGKRP